MKLEFKTAHQLLTEKNNSPAETTKKKPFCCYCTDLAEFILSTRTGLRYCCRQHYVAMKLRRMKNKSKFSSGGSQGTPSFVGASMRS